MADISPQVISKLSQVMFSKNEPPVTSVIWARPQGGSKRSYAFLVFTEGRWQSMSSGGDIPKDISYFNNDVGYITMDDLPEFSSVAYSGDYTDLINTPTIPAEVTESTVAGWGFTKNTGTYSKPSGGIPSTDMSSDVQTSLGKADTALQSFTETDPTVPSWAKASSKPSYTASEVGALPDDTPLFSGDYNDLSNKPTIPAAQVQSDWNATTGMGVILNKPTIPDVSGKVDKVNSATVGRLASFVSGGGIEDSGYKIVTISSSDYDGLATKDANTIYLVTP